MDERDRLHSLDALRGVAALIVALFHWQYTLVLGRASTLLGATFDQSVEPFYWLLRPVYRNGPYAVDLFFVLSGFVFFWLYQRPIAEGRTGPARFAQLRLSRLYPLQVLTLVLVAILQAIFMHRTGQFFAYGNNDLAGFVKGLAFIQTVEHVAFNGPAWSVSVELLMYVAFFVLARIGFARLDKIQGWLGAGAMIGLGLAFYEKTPELARGAVGFFTGGLAYWAFEILRPHRRLAAAAIALAALCWVGMAVDAYTGVIVNLAQRLPFGQIMIPRLAMLYGVFPLTVAAIALSERVFGVGFARLTWLGRISYSSYLIHFSLYLVIAVLYAYGVLSLSAVRSGWLQIAFMATLIALSAVVYSRFELPAQNALRRLGAKGGASAAAAA